MLRIPRALLADIYAHAREGAPHEVCGILAGTADGHARSVAKSFRVRNAHERPTTEYLLDPTEHLRITLLIEDEWGLAVVGFYHSHPAGPARLSGTDVARASWPGASYLLVHLRPTEGHLSAQWDAEAARFLPEDVEITP